MATEPPPPRTGPNWLWMIVIALLAILLVVWLVNPSVDADDAMVEDPIVVPDPAATDAGATDVGATGAALPEAGAGAPEAGQPAPEAGAPAAGMPAGEPIRGTTDNEPPPPPTQ